MKARALIPLIGCLALLVAASPALGAKKKPKKLGKVTTVASAVVSTATDTPVTATATCPGAKKAVGGGWTVTPNGLNQIFVFQSLRGPGEAWTTTARNANDAGVVLTTYVYCRKVKKTIVDVASTAATPAVQSARATASAQCPAKHKLISGGFASSQSGASGNVSYPLTSINSGGAWTYTAQNNVSTSQTLTSHAYCLKGVKSPAVKSQTLSQTVATNTNLTASSPQCTKKKPRMGAGGFSNSHGGGGIPFVLENRLNGSTWLVAARNIAVSNLITVTAQGICLQK